MKALTLYQPWASLIAYHLKLIETRSWCAPQSMIGQQLLIHAALRVPVNGECPGTIDYDALGNLIYWLPEPFTEEEQVAAGLPMDGDLIGFPLPLGAIVASCTLTDCVPILDHATARNCVDVRGNGVAALRLDDAEGIERISLVTDQLPFGDFSTGGKPRFAWLLGDVKPTTERCPACWGAEGTYTDYGPTSVGPDHEFTPCPVCKMEASCAPVPASGRQGLWTWAPA